MKRDVFRRFFIIYGLFPLFAVWLQPADAFALDLEYKAVVHVTDEHHIDVPSEDKRRVGIAGFRGLAIFENGELANYRYQGTYDFLGAEGTFRGYALWQFEDGSQLRATYTGKAVGSGDGIAFSGSHADVVGSGRFESMAGSGSFEGRRVDNLDDGGDTLWTGTLNMQAR